MSLRVGDLLLSSGGTLKTAQNPRFCPPDSNLSQGGGSV